MTVGNQLQEYVRAPPAALALALAEEFALAEESDAPLWALDRRLAAASGPPCTFRTPAG